MWCGDDPVVFSSLPEGGGNRILLASALSSMRIMCSSRLVLLKSLYAISYYSSIVTMCLCSVNLPAELRTPDITLVTFRTDIRRSCSICNCYPVHSQLFPILRYINVLRDIQWSKTFFTEFTRPIQVWSSHKGEGGPCDLDILGYQQWKLFAPMFINFDSVPVWQTAGQTDTRMQLSCIADMR